MSNVCLCCLPSARHHTLPSTAVDRWMFPVPWYEKSNNLTDVHMNAPASCDVIISKFSIYKAQSISIDTTRISARRDVPLVDATAAIFDLDEPLLGATCDQRCKITSRRFIAIHTKFISMRNSSKRPVFQLLSHQRLLEMAKMASEISPEFS